MTIDEIKATFVCAIDEEIKKLQSDKKIEEIKMWVGLRHKVINERTLEYRAYMQLVELVRNTVFKS